MMGVNPRSSRSPPENDFETALQSASSSAASLDTEPWPIPLNPLPDELLSSWLMRLAMAHGVKVQTFSSLTWPTKAVWNRDIDKSADREFISVLAHKSGTSLWEAHATTLSAYEGYLFETLNRFGPTPWLLPVGIYHRVRQRFGQQFCPFCLREDREPYYRRRWRLAFMTSCERHSICLLDRCPDCRSPVNFHRNELSDSNVSFATSITHCFNCSLDFSSSTVSASTTPVTTPEVTFIQHLLIGLAHGSISITNQLDVYSHHFFAGLRQLMRVLALPNQRVANLRQDLDRRFDVRLNTITRQNTKTSPNLEGLDIDQRHQLLNGARILLVDWPELFVELSTKHRVWSSLWLKHLETDNSRWGRTQRTAPFWYWKTVYNRLNRRRYKPSELEISAATQYLHNTKGRCNKKMLADFFGAAIAYKRSSKQ